MSIFRSTRNILLAIACVVVAACATTSTQPTDPAQALFEVKQAYNVAQSAARIYAKLPLCGPTAPKLCADPAIVVQIDDANIAATKAMKAADDAVKSGQPNALILINAASAAAGSLAARTPAVKP